MHTVQLTEHEANEMLDILAEIPLRYMHIVVKVQHILSKKFAALQPGASNGEAAEAVALPAVPQEP